jgi:hypothetical protein
MNFERIKSLLNANGLNGPCLVILKQDANLYTTVLFQPIGFIKYTNHYIKYADSVLTLK